MKAKPSPPDPTDLIKTWTLPFAATLGSSIRAVGIFLEVRARLPAAARKALTIKARELTLRLPQSASVDFAKLVGRITAELDGIESLPLLPREIEDILDRGLVDIWREADAETAAENRRRAAWRAKLKRAPKEPAPASSDGPRPNLRGWEEFEREGLLR
jgi:hypothetical protein